MVIKEQYKTEELASIDDAAQDAVASKEYGMLILKALENLWHVVDEIEHTADMCGEEHIIKQLKGIAFRYDKAFGDLFDVLDLEEEEGEED